MTEEKSKKKLVFADGLNGDEVKAVRAFVEAGGPLADLYAQASQETIACSGQLQGHMREVKKYEELGIKLHGKIDGLARAILAMVPACPKADPPAGEPAQE